MSHLNKKILNSQVETKNLKKIENKKIFHEKKKNTNSKYFNLNL